MDLLHLCLTSTYFQCNDKHYKQLHGTAMGLNFGEILFAGTKRGIPGGQYGSILPARVANQNTEFAAYCLLAELAR